MLESMSAVSYSKGGHAPPSVQALRAQRAGSWGLHHDVADLAVSECLISLIPLTGPPLRLNFQVQLETAEDVRRDDTN